MIKNNHDVLKWIGVAFLIIAPFLAIKTWFGAALAAITGWIFLGGAASIKEEMEKAYQKALDEEKDDEK